MPRHRCIGTDDELALVAKLQDEEAEECSQERPCLPSGEQIQIPPPREHRDPGKEVSEPIKKADRILANPFVDKRTRKCGKQAIGKAGQAKSGDHRAVI